jgi:hypothetical protein
MSIAADFRVINARAHKLETDKPLRYPFEVPGHVARGGDQPQSVILVKYFLEGASALTWELYLNGTRLLANSGSGSHLLMTMEAFDATLLLPGENRVEIRWVHGLGTIRIADMVVHFHVNV